MDHDLLVRTDRLSHVESSTVVFGVAAVEQLGPRIRELEPDGVFVVGDERLTAIVDDVARRVAARATIRIVGDESCKDMATVVALSVELARGGASRRSIVIAVGGGAVTDVVGFLCAVHLRGVRCVLCPTTTLAQCDAALGGKNGVDAHGIKNVLGTTRQPVLVLGDVDWLASQADGAFREGFVEVVKKAAVLDAQRFERLEALAADLVARRPAAMAEAIGMAVDMKLGVVTLDPLERDRRRWLNFGHTIGHAFESVSNFALPHGRAVALGMLAECRAAKGGVQDAVHDRIAALLRSLHIETVAPESLCSARRLWPSIVQDKKVVAGRVSMVVPTSIGVGAVVELTEEQLAAALA